MRCRSWVRRLGGICGSSGREDGISNEVIEEEGDLQWCEMSFE